MILFQLKKMIIYIYTLINSLEKFWSNNQTVTLVKGVEVQQGLELQKTGFSHLSHALLNVYCFIYQNNELLLQSEEKFYIFIFWDAAKAIIGRKFITFHTRITKQKDWKQFLGFTVVYGSPVYVQFP